jgi:ubiquinone/menaquinone biosynthesis C-methylase UbiE
MNAGSLDPNQVLGNISGGRVLDVATGTGGFVRCLLDGLGRARVVLRRPIGLA